MQNYSRVKKYASGNKWGKPVFVPEYKESKDNSLLALVAMVLITSGLIGVILHQLGILFH